MFKTNANTYFNENKVASSSGAVVLVKTENSQFRGKQFIASVLLVASVSVLSLQAGFVLNDSAQDNPVTSPISTEESPSPSPSDSGNPITAPEVSPTPAPTSQPSNNGGGNNGGGNGGNNGGGGSSNSGGSSSNCSNEAPKAPKIISATSAAKNEITLNWEKAQGSVSHYSVSYGLIKGKPLYGVSNIGNVTSYTVKGLSAGVTYYFQVNAVNGCTAGPASNEIGIKGGGKFINTPAVGFKSAVAGKTIGKTVQFKNNNTPTVKVVESSKPVSFKFESGNTLNPGLAGKVVSFFKGLFN